LLPITSATRFSACAGCASASNDASKLNANAALNGSQFCIRIPRLARLIRGSCEPHYAVVGKAVPPVQSNSGGNCAKTLSFFNACRACSIDFWQFAPMFRLDAARYRNAIS
jgi:hypothetical protein